jgi:hypothetical protein
MEESADLVQKLLQVDICVPEGSLERESIHLGVVREYDHPSIGVSHLHVTAFAVDLDKAEPRERRGDPPP